VYRYRRRIEEEEEEEEEVVVVVEEEGLWNGREPRLGIERAVLGDEGVGRYAY